MKASCISSQAVNGNRDQVKSHTSKKSKEPLPPSASRKDATTATIPCMGAPSDSAVTSIASEFQVLHHCIVLSSVLKLLIEVCDIKASCISLKDIRLPSEVKEEDETVIWRDPLPNKTMIKKPDDIKKRILQDNNNEGPKSKKSKMDATLTGIKFLPNCACQQEQVISFFTQS